jgi:alpha-1,2-mannosyltransferase
VFVALAVAITEAGRAAGTVGHDYLAYDGAIRRFLAGGVLYDQRPEVAGGPGLYLYSPPFALALVPLTAFDPQTAALIFTAIVATAFFLACLVMPVSWTVRWLTLLLGAMSWPLAYSIKLGQVGPILLLLFSLGWRWLERPPGPGRPAGLGLSIALGATIKLQPAILLGWALLKRRFRALLFGLGALLVIVVAATIVTGPQAWFDQASLLAQVSQPILTPHNFTPGRIAFELGAPEAVAWGIQVAAWAVTLACVLYSIGNTSAVSSYLITVVASQLLSPVLWDHYAVMLLLPVAWLLSRGRWLAALVPLAVAIPVVGITPPVVYPVLFFTVLAALLVEGRGDHVRDRRSAGLGYVPVRA